MKWLECVRKGNKNCKKTPKFRKVFFVLQWYSANKI